jgi:hypothetical protein
VVLRSKKNGEETPEGDDLEDRLNSFAVTERQAGRLWIWTALAVDSRFIVFSRVGGRTLDDARAMIGNVKKRIANRPLFVSDELMHYETALSEAFHAEAPFPPTGKRGRPRKPLFVLDKELLYATVLKKRINKNVVKIKREIVFGDPEKVNSSLAKSPGNTINTSYIERTNTN